MADRPIIFSAPMIRAILDGRKSMTRRILTPQPAQWEARVIDITPPFFCEELGGWGQSETIWSGPLIPGMCEPEREVWRPLKLPAVEGDRLWVRESFNVIEGGPIRDAAGGQMDYADAEIYYRASTPDACRCWRPSIYMPRWASRITLEVTGVKVERLQEISEADAEAEGCEEGYCTVDGIAEGWSAKSDFARLWNSINGPGAWEANPWVVAISFARLP